jgi:hypothetical protein
MRDNPVAVSKQRFQPSFASLLEGLINDTKLLIWQEVTLVKNEIQAEVRKLKRVALSAGIGMGLAVVGALLLILMLVHLVQTATGLPLWTCYGIVGGTLAGSAAILLANAKANMADVHIVPRKTMATMKEQATWIKEQIASPKI